MTGMCRTQRPHQRAGESELRIACPLPQIYVEVSSLTPVTDIYLLTAT